MSILIIDDDVDVKESTLVMLMDEGYSVELACDGIEGVKMYKKIKPEITFLDIKMPGIDGYETFRRIKEIDHKARIVFITGFSTDNIKQQEAEHRNLLGTIHKPVELKKMLKIINSCN